MLVRSPVWSALVDPGCTGALAGARAIGASVYGETHGVRWASQGAIGAGV